MQIMKFLLDNVVKCYYHCHIWKRFSQKGSPRHSPWLSVIWFMQSNSNAAWLSEQALVQRGKDTCKSFLVITSRDSSTTSRERKADVHINIFADALCIAQHPHVYNTVSSAGVPLQFSDALLWSVYQNNPVFHSRKCDCVEVGFLGWASVRTQARPCDLLSIHAEYDNLVLLYSE